MTSYDGLNYPIKIVQGDDWNFPLTLSTRLNGVKTPVDLTGATVAGTVRPTATTGTAVSMSVQITDAAAGELVLSLTDTQTNSLTAGSLQYQVTVTIAGNTKTYLRGNFVVKQKVQTA